jgi:hypothetical protein
MDTAYVICVIEVEEYDMPLSEILFLFLDMNLNDTCSVD